MFSSDFTPLVRVTLQLSEANNPVNNTFKNKQKYA